MPPEDLYLYRATECAEKAEHASDFASREMLRSLALSWIKLADYRRWRSVRMLGYEGRLITRRAGSAH